MTTPTEAVQHAAGRRGHQLADHVAREIAEAVLAQYDTKVGIQQRADRLQWESDGYREWLLERMHRELLVGAFRERLIPAALPTEKRLYYRAPAHFTAPDVEISAEAIEAGADWESLAVRLSMPVRRAAHLTTNPTR